MVEIISLVLAFHGSFRVSGYATTVITIAYFLFFWLFFSATPAAMLARIKFISETGRSAKVWQVLARLGMCLFLFVGWIPMLSKKNEKKALHDIVAKTKVVYTMDAGIAKEASIKKLQFAALGLVAILFISLVAFGTGEDIRKYAESDHIQFFDLDHDDVPDGLTIDLDKNGTIDIFKYDLDNDRLIEVTTFDADQDGVAESLDVNNDGRIDGFDFDNDNIFDIKVFGGQLFIWLWRAWFGLISLALAGLLAYAVIVEKKD